MKQRILIPLLCAILAVPLIAYCGTLTMTTYYPAPTGNYDNLQANNIGVGTLAIGGQLTVAGSGTGYAYLGPSCAADFTGLHLNGALPAGCSNYNLLGNPNGTLFINRTTGSDGRLFFRKDNNTQMLLSSAGNLGIGSGDNDPAAKLQVVGATILGNGVVGPMSPYQVTIGDTGTDYVPAAQNWHYTLLLNALNTSSIGFHDSGANVGSIRFTNNQFSIGADDGWGTAKTYFADNVGIGVNPPTQKLDVAGNINNNGDITTSGNITIDSTAATFKKIIGSNSALKYFSLENGAGFGNWSGFNGMLFSIQGVEKLRIDSNGNLGIGVVPANKLDVTGNANITGSTTIGTGATISAGNLTVALGNLNVSAGNSTLAGSAGIGAAPSASYRLYVVGNIGVNGDVWNETGGYYYGVPPSDERLKENIHPIVNALNKVKALNGVTFNWKKDKKKSLGLIAQNVEHVFPELVYKDKDGIRHVMYENLVGVLVEAVKEQQKEIDAIKADISDMRNKIKK